MELKQASVKDANQIIDIIDMAKSHLKEQSIDQWQSGYPNMQSIMHDVENQKGFVLCDNEKILAYLCIDFCGEPTYQSIDGKWSSDTKYAVIHRLAVHKKARGKNITQTIFDCVETVCKTKNVDYIRIDTHEDNKKMQHILLKNGFVFCGKIMVADGERLAFDKVI